MRYMIAAEVRDGDLASGVEFKSDEWPHHVTVIPWFDTDSPDVGRRLLSGMAERYDRAKATVGEMALFGVDEDVKVSRLVSDDLVNIHTTGLGMLRDLGLEVNNSRFIGQGYKPHITHHDTGAIPRKGDELTIKSLSLIERIAKGDTSLRSVIKRAMLEG